MATYTTRATIGPDHRLTVDLPGDLPVGEAEVTVVVESGPATSHARGWTTAELLAWLDSQAQRPMTWTPRSRDEVDDFLRELRDDETD